MCARVSESFTSMESGVLFCGKWRDGGEVDAVRELRELGGNRGRCS